MLYVNPRLKMNKGSDLRMIIRELRYGLNVCSKLVIIWKSHLKSSINFKTY